MQNSASLKGPGNCGAVGGGSETWQRVEGRGLAWKPNSGKCVAHSPCWVLMHLSQMTERMNNSTQCEIAGVPWVHTWTFPSMGSALPSASVSGDSQRISPWSHRFCRSTAPSPIHPPFSPQLRHYWNAIQSRQEPDSSWKEFRFTVLPWKGPRTPVL